MATYQWPGEKDTCLNKTTMAAVLSYQQVRVRHEFVWSCAPNTELRVPDVPSCLVSAIPIG